jgi:hypothetical protein
MRAQNSKAVATRKAFNASCYKLVTTQDRNAPKTAKTAADEAAAKIIRAMKKARAA